MRPILAGHARLRVLPRADPCRLHRRRLLRPRRPHRVRQVDGDRRDDVRALRVGASLGPQGNGLPRAGTHRRPRHGQARLRGRRQRYVVARELRRVRQPGQPARGEPGTAHRPARPAAARRPDRALAKDLAGVTEAVERLLGLSYEDFFQCVVLPQGQFADFLHAKPGERQEILLRLLGAEHYRQMMMKANQRASVGRRSAPRPSPRRCAGYADATPEAEGQSRAAETALDRLGAQVAEALPRIREGAGGTVGRRGPAAAIAGRARRPVRPARPRRTSPPSTRTWRPAGRSLQRLRDAEQAAEDADTTARDALQRGPQRAPLELARERRAERGPPPGLDSRACEPPPRRLSALAEKAAGAVDTGREGPGRIARAARRGGPEHRGGARAGGAAGRRAPQALTA